MTQPFRRDTGGAIDRGRPLAFTFDGRPYQGFAGDTLASALLANGVHLVGRSFKYHRPRGILSAGSEEPNALVTLRAGARREPNVRATTAELYDGLVAASQNRWPSLGLDLLSATRFLAPFLPAGFYYKTFMWPASFWEPVYERIVRAAAGLGSASTEPDPDRYEKAHVFCDVLVVGAGPAGLSAAIAAGHAGCRVLLVDERPWLGGALGFSREDVGGRPADEAVAAMAAELGAMDAVTVMTRTTAFGAYEDNVFGLLESVSDHVAEPAPHRPRQRFWTARARRVVLATGAIERPLVFHGNDRPGVMLASAAAAYANRYAVLPGRRAVVATNNDSAYRAAIDLAAAGVEIAALVDARPEPPPRLAEEAAALGIEVHAAGVVSAASGGRRVTGVEVAGLDAGGAVTGPARTVPCDLLCVSGGWSPAVHLHSNAGGRPVYRDDLAAFVPGQPAAGQDSAGACLGLWNTAACLESGTRAGTRVAAAAFSAPNAAGPAAATDERPIRPLWRVPRPGGRSGKAFVDFQHDVGTGDIALAHREGYVSVEHLKRYTTLGMATDQGKTSNVNALALMAEHRGEPIGSVGTTIFRPPYTPVAMGAIAGPDVGGRFRPRRFTPLHDWHAAHGAVFIEAGLWMRARYYPRDGETIDDAYRREAAHVRAEAGIVDISTFNKFDIQGPDAAEFLDRVYANGWSTLPVGKARYGIMLRDDGIILDDGTTSRLGEHRYFMTATTVHGAHVLANLEFLLQTAWPDLRVQVTDVTEHWGAMAVAGPRSREVLAAAVEGAGVDAGALPWMGVREAAVAGAPVRIHRISYSGELAYEVFAPAGHCRAVWERFLEAGAPFGLEPYGTEAMDALRIEKGHISGPEIDGRTTLGDLGLGRFASTKKPFVGSVLMNRPGLVDPGRPRLVGLVAESPAEKPRAGSLVRETPYREPDGESLGHVTSTTYSPMLDANIALALVQGGAEREGQTLYVSSPVAGTNIRVRVVAPAFFDPDGSRTHA